MYQKEHYLVLTETFDSNELWRSVLGFLEKAAKPVSVDLNSFLGLVPEERYESVINILVAALAYAEATPYTAKAKPISKIFTI